MVSDPMRRRKEEEEGISSLSPISRDLRRYYCDYCGICRSKKSLICAHIQLQHKGDLLESDEQFRSRACGGRKTKSITVETLLRTRVVLPGHSSILDNTDQSNLNRLLSEDANEHQG